MTLEQGVLHPGREPGQEREAGDDGARELSRERRALVTDDELPVLRLALALVLGGGRLDRLHRALARGSRREPQLPARDVARLVGRDVRRVLLVRHDLDVPVSVSVRDDLVHRLIDLAQLQVSSTVFKKLTSGSTSDGSSSIDDDFTFRRDEDGDDDSVEGGVLNLVEYDATEYESTTSMGCR